MAKFRVKELARERGLTTEELAIRSGVKISTVRNVWQNRVSDPNYSTLKAIAGVLNVSVEELEAEVKVNIEKNGAPGRLVVASATP